MALRVGPLAALLAYTWAENRYAWSSAQIDGLAATAALLLALFIVCERRAPEPILSLRLFGDRVFAVVRRHC